MAAGDVKIEYGTEVAATITLDDLAESGTWLSGRQSVPIDNTTNKFQDFLLGGEIITHASVAVTVGEIRVYVFGQISDTPDYPGAFSTGDADRTLTVATRANGARLAASITPLVTANITYSFGPVSVAALFGGNMPPRWGVWVTHDTTQNLHATGPHYIWYQPVYHTVAQ